MADILKLFYIYSLEYKKKKYMIAFIMNSFWKRGMKESLIIVELIITIIAIVATVRVKVAIYVKNSLLVANY